MQFRVLGSVEAHVGGQAVDLGPARQRRVLVALLLDANHVVPVEQLMNQAWDGEPAHRGTLYSYVSRLRSALHNAKDINIVRRSGGYLLTVDPMNVDLQAVDRSGTPDERSRTCRRPVRGGTRAVAGRSVRRTRRAVARPAACLTRPRTTCGHPGPQRPDVAPGEARRGARGARRGPRLARFCKPCR